MKKASSTNAKTEKGMRPARTPEARENQLISLAIDLAEKQLRDGSASSQLICHYLKAASEKDKLERKRLEEEVKLITAKTESLQSAKHVEELYEKAMAAMTSYRGKQDDIDED